MMDKDKDGTVSKDEFMEFMSREFDRLDVNKSGKLEPRHLRPMRIPMKSPRRSEMMSPGVTR
jgi:Ca2+-binding EF-hand superfamily protein